jgi:uncharacterized protein YgfB (UPF0149 family)
MTRNIDPHELDTALMRCGSSWNAPQAHGLICSRLALQGPDAIENCMQQVLEGTDENDVLRQECAELLRELHDDTYSQLADRGSEFTLLLPDEAESQAVRTAAMAQWCEGYLHGLVIRAEGERLRSRLASDPLSDIVKDLLEITRAAVDDDADDESNELAYSELQEYLRVAAQLVYEELAEFRRPSAWAVSEPSPSKQVH